MPRPGGPGWHHTRRSNLNHAGPSMAAAAAVVAGTLGPDESYRRLIALIRKGQVRLVLDARAVRTYYEQRARLEPNLYLSILSVAYARLLARLGLAVAVAVDVVRDQLTPAALSAGLMAVVVAELARWRQHRRWLAITRGRLLADLQLFNQAYEDGVVRLQRGQRSCQFPRPWTAILGVEDGRHRHEGPSMLVRPGKVQPAEGER